MFVADLHNDVLQRAITGEDISILTKDGHTDLIRLNQSCIDLEVFVIWITGKYLKLSPFQRAKELLNKLLELEKNNSSIKISKNIQEIKNAKSNGVLSTPFAIEGGEPIEDKIDNLYYFIDKGLLYFGLTWNHSLTWVSSNFDEKYNPKKIQNFGINKFGEEIIRTCNDNGVIVDVSHVGEKSFWDVVKLSNKPFIASHSSVFKICPHFRNLKDDQILAIKKSKGLIGLNPYPFFIDPNFKNKEEIFRKKLSDKINHILKNEKNPNLKWIKKQHFLQKELKKITPSIDLYIDHIEYVIRLIGIDFVGIGSDYDGLDCLPRELEDCLDHIKIAEKLHQRGFKENEIEKVMGLNFLRVLELVKS